jgi:addiction module RelE/StbE family toxin
MPTIIYSKKFTKHIRKRLNTKNQQEKFKERLKIFIEDKTHPLLKDHKLIGKLKDKRAFSITGDIRVVYREINSKSIQFLDIGTHPQVYGE